MVWVTEAHGRVWEHLTPSTDEEMYRKADYRRWESVRPRRYGQQIALNKWYAARYEQAPRPDPDSSGDPWFAALQQQRKVHQHEPERNQ